MKDLSEQAEKERKVEQLIHKAFTDLQIYTSMYMGERSIARGDSIPHEKLWKMFKKKYAFKLSKKERSGIKNQLEDLTQTINPQLTDYVISLVEQRDQLYK